MSQHMQDSLPTVWGPVRPKTGNDRVYWRCRIGHRIHQARQFCAGLTADKNRPALSREKLAERLGLSANGIWEIENGIVPLDAAELGQLAEALNVHPGSFFDNGPFYRGRTPNSPAMHHAMLLKTIEELGDEEREVVTRLIMLLSTTRRSQRSAA